MQISLDTNPGAYTIRSYSEGEIKINDRILCHSLIVSPEQLIESWRPQSLDDLMASDLEIILTMRPEIVLLGTGARLQFPAPSFLAPFLQNGIGIECMDTGAACRTFNVLASESRHVVAALIIR